MEELMSKETRIKVPESERGVMGIGVKDVPPEMMQYYNMPEGAYVYNIDEKGAAAKADLPLYCVIVGLEGYDIDSSSDLEEQLQYYRAGETIELTIMVSNRKGYEEEKISITLEKAK
jgi:serine protease Do